MIWIVTLVKLIVSHSVLSPEEMENGNREIVDEDFKISEEIEAWAKEAELDLLLKKIPGKIQNHVRDIQNVAMIKEYIISLWKNSPGLFQRAVEEVQTPDLVEPVFDHENNDQNE